MAKGWESKAVELQIEASLTPDRSTQHRAGFTPGQVDVRRRREVLLLSRTRVQLDLQSSRAQRYSDQLNRALADIDTQLSALPDIA
jgi:hypothetical protein